MTKQQYQANDYIDVAARIVEFRTQHPEGSLQPADPTTPYRVETIAGDTYIVVVAAAYRSPDDPRPGMGMAYEVYPGRTNFTRGSELQNAETSAWGRAIVAALAADTKRGVASAEEVRNRSAEREDPKAVAVAAVWEQAKRLGMDRPQLRERYAADYSGRDINEANAGDLRSFAEKLGKEGVNGLPLNKDGSVSKRQTTDEERAAAGMMTDEQAKEHKNLAAETVANPKLAERSAGVPADEDPWAIPVATPGQGTAA
jgi:hypothetical protein